MELLSETPLWDAYLERNTPEKRQRFFDADIDVFRAAMKTSGIHIRSTGDQTALGMKDSDLAALKTPATLVLHHGSYIDYLHPITNSRAALTLIPNSTMQFAPYLPEILDAVLPFVNAHTPVLDE
jgi:hypothetical protein